MSLDILTACRLCGGEAGWKVDMRNRKAVKIQICCTTCNKATEMLQYAVDDQMQHAAVLAQLTERWRIGEVFDMDTKMKERALFYLDRRLRALEEATLDQEGMANAGMSYEARRAAMARTDQQNEDNQHEREALQWLRDQTVEKL
jgi:hypothetical protein